MTPLKVFIGYDSREPVGYHVCAHSILTRASGPMSIIPMVRNALPMLTRTRNAMESTEFAFSRFLVPYLSGYEGVSVFMDSDMLVQADIHVVVGTHLRMNRQAAVSVCQHDYTPKQTVKMDGKQQTAYPRKNWSSFMIFNNRKCRALAPDYVNTATGLQLHRFQWINDREIGALPLEWNWLVGEYEKNPNARILHYTNGLPCFLDYQDCDHADLWWKEYQAMIEPVRNGAFAREAWYKQGTPA